MTRLHKLLFLTVVSGLLVAGAARAERYGFKTVELGSHVSAIANQPKYDCQPVKVPTADRICSLRKDETESIAGQPVDSIFYFYDGTVLTGIVIHLPEKHFQTVLKALRTRYGASTDTTETIRNLEDKSFENRKYAWRQGDDTILAERYSGRLDKSSVRITDENAATRIRQRREATARQPASDL